MQTLANAKNGRIILRNFSEQGLTMNWAAKYNLIHYRREAALVLLFCFSISKKASLFKGAFFCLLFASDKTVLKLNL